MRLSVLLLCTIFPQRKWLITLKQMRNAWSSQLFFQRETLCKLTVEILENKARDMYAWITKWFIVPPPKENSHHSKLEYCLSFILLFLCFLRLLPCAQPPLQWGDRLLTNFDVYGRNPHHFQKVSLKSREWAGFQFTSSVLVAKMQS